MIEKKKIYILIAFLCVACIFLGSITTNALMNINKNEKKEVSLIEDTTADTIIDIIMTKINEENTENTSQTSSPLTQQDKVSAGDELKSADKKDSTSLAKFTENIFKYDKKNYAAELLKTEKFKDNNEFFDFLKASFSVQNKAYGSRDSAVFSADETFTGAASPEIAPAAPPMPASDAKADGTTFESGSTPSDYSTTNEQISGVNEADIIKNDGEYLYVLSGNKVKIIKAYPADEMKLLSEISFNADNQTNYYYNYSMYLQDEKLIIIHQYNLYMPYDTAVKTDLSVSSKMIAPDIAYYNYNKMFTQVHIYDISDKSAIKFIKTLTLSGTSTNTRFIGNIMYMTTNDYIYNYGAVPEENPITILPSYYINYDEKKSFNTEDLTILTADCIVKPIVSENFYPSSLVNVVAYDITGNADPSIQSCLGDSSYQIYMNDKNLYLFGYTYEKDKNYVAIKKFSVNGADISLTASGKVPGYMLNQFSADEHNGFFRIATTDWAEGNHLFVLDENLNIVSSIMGLAKGEQIKSARFIGDKGYIVTFQNTDPLFVFDLSDPHNPKITGELKTPGYSNYLHPLSDGLLLGIGDDTTTLYYRDEGGEEIENGFIQTGYKVSLFDISDPYNPKELSKLKLGYNGSWSDITYNHKSFMLIQSRNMFALRGYFVNNKTNDNEMYNYTPQDNKAMLISFDKANGLKKEAEFVMNQNYYYDEISNRTAYIGNVLYHFDGAEISAYDMDKNYSKISGIEYNNSSNVIVYK